MKINNYKIISIPTVAGVMAKPKISSEILAQWEEVLEFLKKTWNSASLDFDLVNDGYFKSKMTSSQIKTCDAFFKTLHNIDFAAAVLLRLSILYQIYNGIDLILQEHETGAKFKEIRQGLTLSQFQELISETPFFNDHIIIPHGIRSHRIQLHSLSLWFGKDQVQKDLCDLIKLTGDSFGKDITIWDLLFDDNTLGLNLSNPQFFFYTLIVPTQPSKCEALFKDPKSELRLVYDKDLSKYKTSIVPEILKPFATKLADLDFSGADLEDKKMPALSQKQKETVAELNFLVQTLVDGFKAGKTIEEIKKSFSIGG